jgi:demethylmenaquinone methyltransferase/2-methoxy-6-polyprenyl-1,4-benzoquinol methylase
MSTESRPHPEVAAAAGNPAPPAEVRRMFDRIARRYDLMNTVMTAGIDARWRADAVAATQLGPGMRALDVACGTGVLTTPLAVVVGGRGRAVGVDLAERMLDIARARAVPPWAARPEYLVADALHLPFADGTFDAVTIGFGLRNLPDYLAGLREMARVARPGGRVVVLEIARPRWAPARFLFETWFRRVVPTLGRIARSGGAYGYLPASVLGYPDPDRIAALLVEAGLEDVRWHWLRSGMATLHVGVVPDRAVDAADGRAG